MISLLTVARVLMLLLSGVSLEDQYFEGTVDFNGTPHHISCACSASGLGSREVPRPESIGVCGVSGSTVVTERASDEPQFLSAARVSQLYGQPRNWRLVPLNQPHPPPEFKCADARWPSNQLYTWGGELAEWLLVSSSLKTAVNETTMSAVLQSYLGHHTLTFCTDRDALSVLSDHAGGLGSLALVSQPTQQETVLSILARNADAHGDSLWRCIVGGPAAYGVEQATLQTLFRSFFALLWGLGDSNPNVRLQTHSGPHNPLAIIALLENPRCPNYGVSIASSQSVLGGGFNSSLLFSRTAIKQRRREIVDLLVAAVGGTEDAKIVESTAEHKAGSWIENCVSASKSVPLYTMKLQGK